MISPIEDGFIPSERTDLVEKEKTSLSTCLFFFWRRHPDLNRGITVLQTVALPLGYDASNIKAAYFYAAHVERITGLEPATSTLARLRSTK